MTKQLVCNEVAAMRAAVSHWHAEGDRVALVPTMGALHEGHLSLVRAARRRAERVIATIFVNPKQFNNAQDLAKYPRTEQRDIEMFDREGVDLVFMPGTGQMYPESFSTTISVTGVSEGLCGAHRPGHFDGVATVVCKLFLQSQADIAFFGEKDYQQLAVIRRMTRDLDLPIEIVGVPTIRAQDGLALSSRNQRLSQEGRKNAAGLAHALFQAAAALEGGADSERVLNTAREEIARCGFTDLEYLELRDAVSLAPVTAPKSPARLLAAAWMEGVRLIDNVPVLPGPLRQPK